MHLRTTLIPAILILFSFDTFIFRRLLIRGMSSVDLSMFPPNDVLIATALPKVELHLHLDGSLSPQFIASRAVIRGVQLPSSPERLREYLMQKKLEKLHKDENKADKGGNWPVFDFCNQFLQAKEELTRATLDLLLRLEKENVVYAEIRFCPSLHTSEGMSEEEAVEAVIAGAQAQTSVIAGVILVALRSKNSSHGLRMAELANKYLQRSSTEGFGVVGMDVAGDEGSYPLTDPNHSMYQGVQEATRLGVPITLHAGEWPEKFGSVGNLKWAIKNNVNRIGHGIAVRSDPDSLRLLKEKNMTVEVCLTSNVGNGFKVENYAAHPVKLLQNAGVSYSLSSDNLLLSGDLTLAPSPTAELLHLALDVGLGWDNARKSVMNGLDAAFSPSITQEVKDRIKARVYSSSDTVQK